MDDSGGAVNSVGGSGGAVGVRGGNPGMDKCDDATSSRISSREMHRVGCENLLERSEVIVGRGTYILDTDNIISLKQRLEMRNGFVMASN